MAEKLDPNKLFTVLIPAPAGHSGGIPINIIGSVKGESFSFNRTLKFDVEEKGVPEVVLPVIQAALPEGCEFKAVAEKKGDRFDVKPA